MAWSRLYRPQGQSVERYHSSMLMQVETDNDAKTAVFAD
jgi:hypothetical protein